MRQSVLVLTFLAAFLNPVLRPSPESVITAFRVMGPLVAVWLVILTVRNRHTHRFLFYLLILTVYSLCVLLASGYAGRGPTSSYLVNLALLILFVFAVDHYVRQYGAASLQRLLGMWFLVMIVLSIHQLLTGAPFPNAPYKEGVARIFFGQENDASIAIAAFLPFVAYYARRFWMRTALAASCALIVYINGTRAVLLAIAILVAILATLHAKRGVVRALHIPWSYIVAGAMLAFGAGIIAVRDVPLPFGAFDMSLHELVIAPLAAILRGERPALSELTSINVRVILVLASLETFVRTMGFGMGPGTGWFIATQYYSEDLVTSIHSFPFQLLAELGWLCLGTAVFLLWMNRRRLDWSRFAPFALYMVLLSASATAGMVTNYYFFACFVLGFNVFTRSALAPTAQSTRRPPEDLSR